MIVLAFTFGLLESRGCVDHTTLKTPHPNPPQIYHLSKYRTDESSMSPRTSISVAFALVNSPSTESTTRETQQISTTPSGIEAVEDLVTREFRLGEEMKKVGALVAEKEKLLGQLAKQTKLVERQAEAIENLLEERNHFLMLLLGVCAGLFFVIFGHSWSVTGY